ncbi:MAG: hypothetical protein QXS85_00075 [Acidilobaceae archaeon]
MESDTVTTVVIISSGIKAKALTHYLVEFSLVASPKVMLENIKSVAVSMRTVTEWSAHDLLDRELGLGVSSFKFVDIQSIPERFRLLIEGEVDVAILPEPWATVALKRGGKLLAKKFTECCMDLFSSEILSKEVAKSFLYAIREALKAIRNNPEQYLRLLLEETSLPPEALDSKVFSLFFRDDYVRIVFPRDLFDNIADWAERRGYVKTKPRYDDVFYSWIDS